MKQTAELKKLVVGLGNRWRGEDGVGPLVLDALRKIAHPSAGHEIDYLESPADSLTLVNAWQNREHVYLIDACVDDTLKSGTIIRLDLTPLKPNETEDRFQDQRPGTDDAVLKKLRHPTSSHMLDLKQALTVSQTLGAMPKHLTVYAIVISQFDIGAPLSQNVNDAVTTLAKQLNNQLNQATG
ncbi:MAG: hydrogenase maturation protease [Gammaproteobacteria bacterium]